MKLSHKKDRHDNYRPSFRFVFSVQGEVTEDRPRVLANLKQAIRQAACMLEGVSGAEVCIYHPLGGSLLAVVTSDWHCQKTAEIWTQGIISPCPVPRVRMPWSTR